MEDEKLLPEGEQGIEVTALPTLRSYATVSSIQGPTSSSDMPNKKEGMPSQKQQQWGVVISIIIIVMMIVVGAFYAWGKRVAQNVPPAVQESTQ